MCKAVLVAVGLWCLVTSALRPAPRPGNGIARMAAAPPGGPPPRPATAFHQPPSLAQDATPNRCSAIYIVYARGTWEAGKLGALGPLVAGGLRSKFPSLAIDGVAYAAGVATNTLPDGADPLGVSDMNRRIRLYLARCPKSVVIIGGYSQGAAIVHAAARRLSASERSRILAVFLFGDTRFAQDGGRVPGFPSSKNIIICNQGDEVCHGWLVVLPPHLMYATRVDEVVAFLSRAIAQAGVGSVQ